MSEADWHNPMLCKVGADGTALVGTERLLKAIVKRGLAREHLRAAALLIIVLEEFVREERRADKWQAL